MKKALVLVLAFIMLSFIACGKAEDKKEEEVSISDYGIGAIVSGAGLDKDCIYSSFNEEQRTSLVNYARKQGVEVSFTEDGTTVFVFTGEDGSVVKQDKNGTVSSALVAAEDISAGLQSDWPQNDYTAKLPVPPFKVVSASAVAGVFNVSFESFDREAALAYTEQLKAFGFTLDAKVMDAEGLYMFTAKNADGDCVTFSTPCLLTLELGK